MRKILVRFLLLALTLAAALCVVSCALSIPDGSNQGEKSQPLGSGLRAAPVGSGAYPYGTVLGNDNQMLVNSYSTWKSKYVTSSGASGYLRVQRPENNNDTVSEGIGYGMLIAVYMNDQATFNSLWSYAQKYLDADGLMNWQIDSSGNVIGQNGATDADEDMTLALVAADKLWGGYTSQATGMIQKIYNNEVESGTYCIKPGDVWGGSACMNPSYFATAEYRVFAQYSGNTGWTSAASECYTVLNANKNATTGLVMDWCQANGTPSSQQPGGTNYLYDACRVPMRISLDYLWFGTSSAQTFLNTMIGWFANIGAANIKSSYTVTGTPLVTYQDCAFLGPIAAGSCSASVSSTFRSDIFTDLTNRGVNNNYYNDSLAMICMLITTGHFPNPLTLSGNSSSSAAASSSRSSAASSAAVSSSASVASSAAVSSSRSSVASSVAVSSSRSSAASSAAVSSSRSSAASSVAVSSSRAASSAASSAAVSSAASSTAGGYAVNYTVNNDWGAGATCTVTIKNNSAAAVNGWTLVWTYTGNQTLTQIWNAAYTASGETITVTNASFNNVISANGGTQSFGFNLSYSGSNAKPTAFTLNGTACTTY